MQPSLAERVLRDALTPIDAPERQIPNDPDALLSELDVAHLFGISWRTLQSWRQSRRGPPIVKAGKLIRYRRADLAAWIAAHTTNFDPTEKAA